MRKKPSIRPVLRMLGSNGKKFDTGRVHSLALEIDPTIQKASVTSITSKTCASDPKLKALWQKSKSVRGPSQSSLKIIEEILKSKLTLKMIAEKYNIPARKLQITKNIILDLKLAKLTRGEISRKHGVSIDLVARIDVIVYKLANRKK